MSEKDAYILLAAQTNAILLALKLTLEELGLEETIAEKLRDLISADTENKLDSAIVDQMNWVSDHLADRIVPLSGL